jgi:Domain of unknown function DUF29
MTIPLSIETKALYDRDFQLWIETTVQQLRDKDFDSIDWENLIEEIEDMGKNNQNAIKSLLTQLLAHLFKIAYWDSEKAYNLNKWRSEIRNFRLQIIDILEDSPSLKALYLQTFDSCYGKARKIVSDLIGRPIPPEKIVTPEEALDEDWFPKI